MLSIEDLINSPNNITKQQLTLNLKNDHARYGILLKTKGWPMKKEDLIINLGIVSFALDTNTGECVRTTENREQGLCLARV